MFDLLWFVVANLNALSKVVPPMQRASGGVARIQEVLSAREGVADRAGARTSIAAAANPAVRASFWPTPARARGTGSSTCRRSTRSG